MKKFCINCKWFRDESGYIGYERGKSHWCNHPNNLYMKMDPIEAYLSYRDDPEKKNSRNNCIDYTERKSLWSIVSALFRSK